LICDASEYIVMHHVRHIRKTKVKGFTALMSKLNRKQVAYARAVIIKLIKVYMMDSNCRNGLSIFIYARESRMRGNLHVRFGGRIIVAS
jgi:hypothetical protein